MNAIELDAHVSQLQVEAARMMRAAIGDTAGMIVDLIITAAILKTVAMQLRGNVAETTDTIH